MFTIREISQLLKDLGVWEACTTHLVDPRKRHHYPLIVLVKALILAHVLGIQSLNGLEHEGRSNARFRKWCGLDKGPCAETYGRMVTWLTQETLHHVRQHVVRRLVALGYLPKGAWVAIDGSGLGAARGEKRVPLAVFLALVTPEKVLNLALKGCPEKKGEEPMARELVREILPLLRELGVRGLLLDAGYCDGKTLQLARELKLEVVCRIKQENFCILGEAQHEWARTPHRIKQTIMRFGSKRYFWEFWETWAFSGLGEFHEPIRLVWLRQTRLDAKDRPMKPPEEHWCLTLTPSETRPTQEVLTLMRRRWMEENGLFRQAKRVMELDTFAPKKGRLNWWDLGVLAKALLEWLRAELAPETTSLHQFQLWVNQALGRLHA